MGVDQRAVDGVRCRYRGRLITEPPAGEHCENLGRWSLEHRPAARSRAWCLPITTHPRRDLHRPAWHSQRQCISCPEVDEFVFRTTHLVTTDPSTAVMSAEAVRAGRLDACPTQATCRHGTLIRG